MKYSIPVVCEGGKNYFLACHEDMRFLFQRLDASCFIATPEGEDMDQFEIRRNEEVIIAGDCYSLERKIPVFIIKYSEVAPYSPMRNYSTPHQTLFAEDFLPDDRV